MRTDPTLLLNIQSNNGLSLAELQTKHPQIARGKATLETQMILNHKNAIELLVSNSGTTEFNHYTLMNLHSALAENLLSNPADEGRIRRHAVDISKSVYRPLSTPQQLQTACMCFSQKCKKLATLLNNPSL